MTFYCPWERSINADVPVFSQESQGLLKSVRWSRNSLVQSFLSAGIDRVDEAATARWVLCDPYPESVGAISMRTNSQILVIFAGGSLPRGAEPLSTTLLGRVHAGDVLIVTCSADARLAQSIFGDDLRIVQIQIPTGPEWDGQGNQRIATMRPDFVYHGRINRQKNIDLILLLLRDLLHIGLAATLKIIGNEDGINNDDTGESNTGYAKELHMLSREFGISDQITWISECSGDQLVAHVREAGIGINLSTFNRENFGMTTAEHAACGLPILVSDWGGLRDHGQRSGAMFAPTSVVNSRPRVDASALAPRLAEHLLRGEALSGDPVTPYRATNLLLDLLPVFANGGRSGPLQSYDRELNRALLARARRARELGVNPRLAALDPQLHAHLLSFYASDTGG